MHYPQTSKLSQSFQIRYIFTQFYPLIFPKSPTLNYITKVGASKIRAFIRNSKNWRVNRWFVLFAIGYLAEQSSGGEPKLKLSPNGLVNLVADVFSRFEWKRNGALFQLTQLAYFHIQNQHGQNQPAVKGIELERPAFTLVRNKRPGGVKAFRRRIDIVLEVENNTERWIETKSLEGPFRQVWFTNTLKAKSNKDEEDSRTHRGYFRQFFQDMRLNQDFINRENRALILDNVLGNAEYTWYFHDFGKKRGVPPTARDITQARKWLCKVPEVENRQDFYKSNLSGTAGEVRTRCALNAVISIQKRNTQSYIKDLLKPYASQMGIEDFVEIIEKLDP